MIDSYFGFIGNSFYAGPNGTSFQIKYVFPNKVALNIDEAEIVSSSPVQVGDYVIISYGDKNTQEYLDNKETDEEELGGYWNATLWQKKFGQPVEGSTDQIYYENIVTFSSAEPELVLTSASDTHADTIPFITLDEDHSTSLSQQYIASLPTSWNMQVGTVTPINPGISPDIVINQDQYSSTGTGEDHNSKYVHFKLPNAWNIELGTTIIYHPGQDPNVTITQNNTTKTFTFALPKAWDIQLGPNSQVPINPGLLPSVNISYDPTTAGVPATENSDIKYLYFKLPKAWQFAIGTISQQANPGTSALADWSYDVNSTMRKEPNENDTTVYMHFKIPNAWDIQLGSVTAALPDTTPAVAINQIDGNGQTSLISKYLHFTLPVSQSFQGVTITPLSPIETPSANLVYAADDTVHKYPTIALRLPAAIKTLYGSALMRTDNYTIRPNIDTADYQAIRSLSVGDYYINTTLAAVHRINSIDANTGNVETRYEGTMQLAVPTITTNIVNPYDSNGNPTQPKIVTSTTTSPVNAWNVAVDTIVAPIFQNSSDSGFVASTATGEISSRASNQYVTWTFKIPRGTKLTTYTRVTDKNSIKSSSLDGDMYLDNIGSLYIYTGNGTSGDWSSAGTLKGNSFQVKNSSAITVTDNDLLPYSGTFYEKVGAYIDENYSSMMATYKLNEIININYQVDVDVWASHWLFKASNSTWSGSQLTGDASTSIIVTDWESQADDSKAYSVTLINSLRATITSLQNQVATLQAEVDKGWGIMADNGLVPYNPEG